MAEADARSLIEKAASAPDLASLRRPAAARYGKTGPFTRGVAEIPALGRSAEAIKVAFSLTPEARVAPDPVAVGTSRVVLRLKDLIKAPDSPLAQDLDPFRQRLVEDKRRKTMVLWLETARAKAEREGELERNARALRDFLGPAPGSPS